MSMAGQVLTLPDVPGVDPLTDDFVVGIAETVFDEGLLEAEYSGFSFLFVPFSSIG